MNLRFMSGTVMGALLFVVPTYAEEPAAQTEATTTAETPAEAAPTPPQATAPAPRLPEKAVASEPDTTSKPLSFGMVRTGQALLGFSAMLGIGNGILFATTSNCDPDECISGHALSIIGLISAGSLAVLGGGLWGIGAIPVSREDARSGTSARVLVGPTSARLAVIF